MRGAAERHMPFCSFFVASTPTSWPRPCRATAQSYDRASRANYRPIEPPPMAVQHHAPRIHRPRQS